MAVLTTITCTCCHQLKTFPVGSGRQPSSICPDCQALQAHQAREQALNALKALSVDERLARIEALLYDHARVPHAHVPPTLF